MSNFQSFYTGKTISHNKLRCLAHYSIGQNNMKKRKKEIMPTHH